MQDNEKAVPVHFREHGTAFHYAGLAPFGESHAQPEIVRG